MNTTLVLYGAVGLVLSVLAGILLYSKIGRLTKEVTDAWVNLRLEEGMFNASGESCVGCILVLVLNGILMIPLGGCLISFYLIALGLGSR